MPTLRAAWGGRGQTGSDQHRGQQCLRSAEGGEGLKPMDSAQRFQKQPGKATRPRKHRTQGAPGTGESHVTLGTESVTGGCTGPGGEVTELLTQALGAQLL